MRYAATGRATLGENGNNWRNIGNNANSVSIYLCIVNRNIIKLSIMKRVLKYTSMMVSALMVSAACYGSVRSSQQKEQASMESKGKILIVFFSHAG